jgi:hypothetical protein
MVLQVAGLLLEAIRQGSGLGSRVKIGGTDQERMPKIPGDIGTGRILGPQ